MTKLHVVSEISFQYLRLEKTTSKEAKMLQPGKNLLFSCKLSKEYFKSVLIINCENRAGFNNIFIFTFTIYIYFYIFIFFISILFVIIANLYKTTPSERVYHSKITASQMSSVRLHKRL